VTVSSNAAAALIVPQVMAPGQILADLDDDQAMILLATLNESALINAGAGSGKTRLLVSQIAYQVSSGQYRPDQIVAITFTNKAGNEMRNRLSSMIGPSAIDKTNGVWIGTFHAFCIRLLRQFGGKDLGWGYFHIMDEDEQKQIFRTSMQQLNLMHSNVDVQTCKKMISLWKNRMLPARAIIESGTKEQDAAKITLGQIYEKYVEIGRKKRAMDFDDLLLYTAWGLRKNGHMRQFCHDQFKHWYIDEFQDTNLVQLEIAKQGRNPDAKIEAVGEKSLPTLNTREMLESPKSSPRDTAQE